MKPSNRNRGVKRGVAPTRIPSSASLGFPDDGCPLITKQILARREWSQKQAAKDDAQFTIIEHLNRDSVEITLNDGKIWFTGYAPSLDFLCEQVADFRWLVDPDSPFAPQRREINRRVGWLEDNRAAIFDYLGVSRSAALKNPMDAEIRPLRYARLGEYEHLDASEVPKTPPVTGSENSTY